MKEYQLTTVETWVEPRYSSEGSIQVVGHVRKSGPIIPPGNDWEAVSMSQLGSELFILWKRER